MIVRIGLLRKKEGMTEVEFSRHWLGRHAALASRLPGLARYEQNHVIDHAQRGISYPRGSEVIDGFSMLWFANEQAMHEALQSDAARALAIDEEECFSSVRILTIDQLEVIPPTSDRPSIKRMSTLRRRGDVSPEMFRHEWRIEHARLVKRIDRVRGYRQNLVVDRESPKGQVVDRTQMPIDGIVELWFDDKDNLDAAFGSPQGATLMCHAREFIAEIATFLVERHVIV